MTRDEAEKMYRTCYMKVFSYCMTLSGDRCLAEEVTQEAFFRAFTRREQYRGESGETTWLCTIARNIFIDEKRRSGRFSSIEDMTEELPDGAQSMDRTIAVRDNSYRVHMELSRLEEPYRQVFELRVFGELGFREIGQRFGKTENWARVTYHRARLRLQERIEKSEDPL